MPQGNYKKWKIYRNWRSIAQFFSGQLIVMAIVLAATALFTIVEDDATANDVQKATDKSDGKHGTWDWLMLSFAIALVAEYVFFLIDFFHVRHKEQKARTNACSVAADNVKFWLIAFMVWGAITAGFTLVVWFHAIFRRADDKNSFANQFYNLMVAATTISAVAQAILLYIWGWSYSNLPEACNISGDDENARLIQEPNGGSNRKARKMVNGQPMFKRQ